MKADEKTPKIDILISTKDNVKSLLRCLTTLNQSFTSVDKQKVRVIVVDNASNIENRKEELKQIVKFDIFKNMNIEMILLKEETDFISTLNIALNCSLEKDSNQVHIAIIKDDAALDKKWRESLLNELNFEESVLAVSLKVKDTIYASIFNYEALKNIKNKNLLIGENFELALDELAKASSMKLSFIS